MTLQATFASGVLKDRVFVPGDPQYKDSQDTYFSNQARQLKPQCIFRPESVEELSAGIKTLHKLHDAGDPAAKFVVRSSGYTVNPDWANTDGGLTIDMRSFRELKVSDDHSEVTIGAGLTWDKVYETLDKLGLTVAGCRVGSVGVCGFVLGGGLSFFSPRVGFACDTVTAYDIILADGSLEHVTRASHPDLYWALKGGGNNFGIVASFTMRTLKAGSMFGGCFAYDWNTAPAFLDAFHSFATETDTADDNVSVMSTYSFRQGQGYHVFNSLEHTSSSVREGEGTPTALRSFTDIAKPLYETGRVATHLELVNEQADLAKPGFQNCYANTSFYVSDAQTLHDVLDVWKASAAEIEDVPGICWAIGFQAITPSITRKSKATGGNVLGLEDAPSTVMALITNFWDDARYNERLVALTMKLVGDIEEKTKERGVCSAYKYLNFCWEGQDAFGGYGEVNHDRLRKVAERYDGSAFWRRANVGGLKLG